MADLFGELYNLDINKILQKTTDLKILVLGAYRPENMLERLKTIRDCLRHKGFINTYIVADFPDDKNRFHGDDDIHWTKKSNVLMKNSDLNLFILFGNCDNSGPVDELNYFFYEIRESFRCIVLYEEGSTENISSRLRAKIKEFDLRNVAVKEGDDMLACDLAYGLINIVLMKEQNRIYKNIDFPRTI